MTLLSNENRIGIAITLVLIATGTAYYFSAGLGEMGPSAEANAVLRSSAITVTSDGAVLKLFATASHNALARLTAAEGEPIPEGDMIIIGSAEAAMMREEGLFSGMGDRIDGLFGIDVAIGGVLAPTGTIIDDMHFVSEERYAGLDGDRDRAFVEFLGEEPKLFYTRQLDETMPFPLRFAEGSDEGYVAHTLGDTVYAPVVIGSAEAAMMREEGLFSSVGDRIDGFFGQDVIIVGVLEETGTALDMMHILPFDADTLA